MTISVKSRKSKGRKLQQLVRDDILDRFPILEKDDVRSTSMGAAGEDIQLSPKAREWFPFTVECKARASFAIYPMFEQAAGKNHTPLLVIKADRKDPLVVLNWNDFLDLVS